MTLGSGYKEKIRAILAYTTKSKQSDNTPIMKQLTNLPATQARPNNVKWTKTMFRKSNISLTEFFAWFIMFADKRQ